MQLNETPGFNLPEHVMNWLLDNGDRIEFEASDSEGKQLQSNKADNVLMIHPKMGIRHNSSQDAKPNQRKNLTQLQKKKYSVKDSILGVFKTTYPQQREFPQ